MIWFRQTKIVTITEGGISIIPLVIGLVLCYYIVKDAGKMESLLINLALWMTVILGPCILGFIGLAIYGRRLRTLKYKTARTHKDIPVITYTLTPEIEEKGVTINELTIEEKLSCNSPNSRQMHNTANQRW
jgi:hypothetical protein